MGNVKTFNADRKMRKMKKNIRTEKKLILRMKT